MMLRAEHMMNSLEIRVNLRSDYPFDLNLKKYEAVTIAGFL